MNALLTSQPGAQLAQLKAAPRRAGEATFFYCDAHFKNNVVKVLPGEFFVHDEDLLAMTTLGSCIAACLWDRERRDGGRYGAYAMELLINELIKRGASRMTLQAKVFGGGAVIGGMNSLNVGDVQHPLRARLPQDRAHCRGQQRRAGRLPTQGLLPAGQRQGHGQAPGDDQFRQAGGAGTRRGANIPTHRQRRRLDRPVLSQSRNVSHPTPPPQIRTCGTTAYGSCLGS